NDAEKRAVEKDGHNLDIDYAKSQMKQTRELFSKNDGIQAHHVIESFKPDEVTPEKANQVGLELAKKLAPNHEVARSEERRVGKECRCRRSRDGEKENERRRGRRDR